MFRNLKAIISVIFITCLSVLALQAQVNKRYIDDCKEIDEYIMSEDYDEALYILQNLEKNGFSNAKINYLKGFCYLNTITEKSKAIACFEKAIKGINPNYSTKNFADTAAPIESWLYLGDANLVNNKLDEAKAAYKKYISYPGVDIAHKNLASRKIKECYTAKVLLKHPIRVTITNPGEKINAGLADFNPCISGDGKTMVFTRKLKFYDAIFITLLDSSGWSEPENITNRLGSDGEYSPTGLSYDGTHMLLSSFIPLEGFGIFESSLENGKWTKLKKLGAAFNSRYNDMDAVYAAHDNWIYFSSNRENGYGGYDLYRVNLKNKADSAENLGATINTAGDERKPNVTNNGEVLVYSSNYGLGMGCQDFYYSKLNSENNWETPCNVGYPLNTTADDMYLTFKDDGATLSGLTAAYKSDSYTDIDIYSFKAESFSKYKLVPVKGMITLNNSEAAAGENREVIFIDNSVNDTADVALPDKNGAYVANLYPGEFNVVVTNNSVEESKQNFTVPDEPNEGGLTLVSNIVKNEVPQPSEEPQIKYDTVYVGNIYFDYDKYELSGEGQQLIDQLIDVLGYNRIDSIKLNGYTDSKGSLTYNIQLSELRANAVKEFLVKSVGIDSSKIKTLGMGNTGFIAINNYINGTDCPEGRAFNRRVEINIIVSNPRVIFIRKVNIPANLKIKK